MKHLKKQSGQAVVEVVLLLVLTTGLGLLVTGYLKESKFAQKLVSQPWQVLSGMIECGVWSGCAPGKHPATLDRVLSHKPAE